MIDDIQGTHRSEPLIKQNNTKQNDGLNSFDWKRRIASDQKIKFAINQ